jgi:prepilin-type N-terminal cleavage/methylation domain-containing protein
VTRASASSPIGMGFTLIELLVVVTIILVLLALLTPALDKAIYQAELAVCAARLDGLGAGVTTYAMNHARWYPVRGMNTPHRQPHRLVGPNDPNLPQQWSDERLTLKGFVDLKQLLDPMSAPIELQNTNAGAEVYTSYMSWYGWRFLDPSNGFRPFPAMNRIGDRFEWRAGNSGPTYRFSVLAGDYDEVQAQATNVVSGHPDRDSIMVPQVAEDGPSYGTLRIYLSRWVHTELVRGPLDLNYAMADGSVLRFSDVRLSESNAFPFNRERDHLVPVPQTSQAGNEPNWYNYLPPGP